jgi:hypothetical protein
MTRPQSRQTVRLQADRPSEAVPHVAAVAPAMPSDTMDRYDDLSLRLAKVTSMLEILERVARIRGDAGSTTWQGMQFVLEHIRKECHVVDQHAEAWRTERTDAQ